MDNSKEIERGELARQVIENELYKEAFSMLHDGIIDSWKNCPLRDKEGQHELKLMLKLLVDVQKYLEDVMDTGKMAKIEREGKLAKIARAFKGGA